MAAQQRKNQPTIDWALGRIVHLRRRAHAHKTHAVLSHSLSACQNQPRSLRPLYLRAPGRVAGGPKNTSAATSVFLEF